MSKSLITSEKSKTKEFSDYDFIKGKKPKSNAKNKRANFKQNWRGLLDKLEE